MLRVENLTKSFKGKSVVNAANFSLNRGIVGLLGPNGAGKTTLLRLLATYFTPDQGSIRWDQMDWSVQTEQVRRQIGYLPQHTGTFPSLTAYEYLEYMGNLRGISSKQLSEDIPSVLKEVNLEDKQNEKTKSLSGGMKRRLGIAQAILHKPMLLLVDEPTAGLDPEERIRFRNLIRRLGEERLIILSTHITEDVSMTCEKVLLMKNGKVEYYDSVNDVTRIAYNQTWEIEADSEVFSQIRNQPDLLFTQTTEKEGGNYFVRLLSPEQPHVSATPAMPNLEEGYMIWLNKN